ncbi:ribonuclease G [Pseudoalteromonas ruthenica]|uniref:Ribonuclease G n=1 Tax=Pseudoalteromonas ruthenica TaxID=151081 RepID=A0A0F4Q229_9GAMM|nr:ribonuclease G [Pseudoalteromonas ruthenica]KJY97681.1 ribonuclease G [Pseudoalteromonas ruthenica]KJZ01708.1 ribonuclease G [Pseudoalteromonas ruthenica]TMO89071.1 ribonuclease G [Pseudoalteromonas ruthenica]TMO94895.1 ribonuclease G [Pseudoalteromonas ruthenica]TMO97080.1 ribonuclease G [Pseudoalteromonas ruthenica]
MSSELLINVTPSESRVALIENGVLQEVQVERIGNLGIVGNIYLGKVSRVLPGMQAAFVDIGLEKAAFLHASDIVNSASFEEGVDDQHIKKVQDIRELVRQGQHIMVQVVKDPIGTKGARLTTDITIPSRYLVFMPDATHVGVSQRIEGDEERQRLKNIVAQYNDENGGFIVRTAAEGASEHELKHDAEFLKKLWLKIVDRRKKTRKENILHEDLKLAFRTLRDYVGEDMERIRVDSKLTYQELTTFTEEFVPHLAKVLEYYPGERPIFDLFDVENEIQKALHRKVELKSGGYLIIDQTEAMTTVDVNTGAFVGHRNLEETIFNTNIEATSAIARQLRLRNLGGIIIIDFIDMVSEEHKRRVLHSLEQALSKDRAKANINSLSALGLVEMTRKRTRESLEHILCGVCPSCAGRGSLKTVETVCYEILREIVRVNRAYDADKFMVYASAAVSEALINDEYHNLAELELFIGKQVMIQTENLYSQEQFDVVMM